MSIQRSRTPSDLVALAGRMPTAVALAAVLSLSLAPSLVQAQGGQPGAEPPKMRDPLKPEKKEGQESKVVVGEHMTVDLHVKDEDLSNVLELLSIQTQKNIIASKNVSAKVTATLYGVTFYQALDAILHVNGFGYLEQGNFIYVYTNEELKQIEAALKKRVSKVIRLNYLNAADAKEFVTPLLSKDGGEIKTNGLPTAFNIPDKSPVGKNDYALSDTIVIIDYEENIKAIEELVKQIDTRPAQVLVEATILQTAINEANAFGVDFSIIGDIKFSDFINIGGPLSAANNLILGGTGASGRGLSPSDNQGTAVVSNPGNTSGPGTFKVGVVAGDLSIFLKALDQVTDTTILSNPKILALNRQPARVLVGKRVGYLSTTSTDTSTTQTVEFLDTGTQLYFRPFVSSEGEIRMELKPQVSVAEIRDVTDSTGAIVTIPDEITQELVTNVNIRDGQTVVLGGLFTEDQSFTRRQVPFLGDLPIVGTAFRGNDDSTKRSEIIFLITPSIVTDSAIAAAAERAGADMERIRAGSRQGLLVFSRERMTSQLNVEAERAAREGDYEKALWDIKRSLSLNPHQVEAYRLRDRITGEREHWSDPSIMNEIIDSEVTRRMGEIKPSPSPLPHQTPTGDLNIPREKIKETPAAPAGVHKSDDQPSAPSANASPASNLAPEATVLAASLKAANVSWQEGRPLKSSDKLAPGATSSTAPAAEQSDKSAHANLAPLTTEAQQVRTTLPSLRGQIELFSVMNNGSLPTLGDGKDLGWTSLTSAEMIKSAPVNTWVGGEYASTIVQGDGPDVSFHSNYGWIFNPKTGQLWAAGFDANDNPLAKPNNTASATPLNNRSYFECEDDSAWSLWFGFSPRQMFSTLPPAMQQASSDQPQPQQPAQQTTGAPVESDTNK